MESALIRAAPASPHPLRRWRFERNISVRQLAKEVGCHEGTIIRLEGRKRNVTLDILGRIKSATGLGPEHFLPEEKG